MQHLRRRRAGRPLHYGGVEYMLDHLYATLYYRRMIMVCEGGSWGSGGDRGRAATGGQGGIYVFLRNEPRSWSPVIFASWVVPSGWKSRVSDFFTLGSEKRTQNEPRTNPERTEKNLPPSKTNPGFTKTNPVFRGQGRWAMVNGEWLMAARSGSGVGRGFCLRHRRDAYATFTAQAGGTPAPLWRGRRRPGPAPLWRRGRETCAERAFPAKAGEAQDQRAALVLLDYLRPETSTEARTFWSASVAKMKVPV